MKQAIAYNLTVKDSICNPYSKESPSYYKVKKNEKGEDLTFYRVWIYLDGPDLPFVKRVKYTLHHSFSNRVQIVESTPRNPKCALPILTWGVFKVKVEIEDIGSRIYQIEHYLNYDDEFENEAIKWERATSASLI